MTGCPVHREFDAFGGAYHADAGAALRAARAEQPVFYSQELDYWVVTRYADIRRVFRDVATFSAGNAMDPILPLPRDAVRTLVRHRFTGGPVIANEDEPVHGARRERLARPFTRARVERLAPRIRSLVTERIDGFVDRGHADLVGELLWDVPALVALMFMGVPDDDLARVREFSVSQAQFTWGRPAAADQVRSCEVMGAYWEYAGELVGRLKAGPKADGWIPHAIRAQARSPELFSDSYLRSLVLNGSTAAHETTASAAANAIRTLLEHPASWAELCADPTLVPGAIEECLRLRPSVVSWRRKALHNTVIAGTPVPAGAKLLLVTASANRDDTVFDQPDVFDIRRPNARRHLTFGDGNHACLGAALARLQLRVLLTEVTRRLPDLRLADGQDFDHAPNTSFHGPDRLWVRWP